jgi:hypothetical protein
MRTFRQRCAPGNSRDCSDFFALLGAPESGDPPPKNLYDAMYPHKAFDTKPLLRESQWSKSDLSRQWYTKDSWNIIYYRIWHIDGEQSQNNLNLQSIVAESLKTSPSLLLFSIFRTCQEMAVFAKAALRPCAPAMSPSSPTTPLFTPQSPSCRL